MYTYNHSIQKTETSRTPDDTWSYPYANEFKTSPDANNSRSVYYNYRYYSPELGRWLSRDPIAERGFRLFSYNNKIAKVKKTITLQSLYSEPYHIDDSTTPYSQIGLSKVISNKKNSFHEIPYLFVFNAPVLSWDKLGLTPKITKCYIALCCMGAGAGVLKLLDEVGIDGERDGKGENAFRHCMNS